MTKKCACGKEIDDRWDECYACNQKKRQAESPTDRQASIERQVAAKCVAQVYNGRTGTEDGITRDFNLFLKLIRGA